MKWIPKFIILFSLGIFVASTAPASAYYRGLPNRNAGQDWATRPPSPVTNAGTKQKQVKPVKTTKQQQTK